MIGRISYLLFEVDFYLKGKNLWKIQVHLHENPRLRITAHSVDEYYIKGLSVIMQCIISALGIAIDIV